VRGRRRRQLSRIYYSGIPSIFFFLFFLYLQDLAFIVLLNTAILPLGIFLRYLYDLFFAPSAPGLGGATPWGSLREDRLWETLSLLVFQEPSEVESPLKAVLFTFLGVLGIVGFGLVLALVQQQVLELLDARVARGGQVRPFPDGLMCGLERIHDCTTLASLLPFSFFLLPLFLLFYSLFLSCRYTALFRRCTSAVTCWCWGGPPPAWTCTCCTGCCGSCVWRTGTRGGGESFASELTEAQQLEHVV
jgi:hypothetical protein